MGGKDYLKLSIEWHRVSRLFWPGLSIKIPFSWRGVKMVMFCSPVAVVTKWSGCEFDLPCCDSPNDPAPDKVVSLPTGFRRGAQVFIPRCKCDYWMAAKLDKYLA